MMTSMTKTLLFLLTLAALLLTACIAPPAIAPSTTAPPSTEAISRVDGPAPSDDLKTSATVQVTALISLPISLYILDDETDAHSSARTVEEVKRILANANEIWSQAGIELDVQNVQRLIIPAPLLEEIAQGEFSGFFRAAGIDFSIPDLSLINGFYVRAIGGPNGIAPSGTRTFFVMDEPSVHDERVTSHEVSHILGLHHTLDDRGRLLYPGTNGTSLTDEESVVARYVAQGLLTGVR